MRPDRLRAILDPVDAHAMASAVAEEAQRATGVLLVYFIGHGLLGPDDTLYLAASGTDQLVPGLAVHQALSFATLREAITNSKARTRVVMLDCCYSGRASLDNARLTPAFDMAPANGMYFLGAAQQQALAPPDTVHTTFTGELIELLTQGDPLEPPMLTLDVVNRLLFRRMSDSGRPVPRYQADDRAGSLVIAQNPASPAPARLSTEVEQALGRCPWPSLRSFGVGDADVFFGRDEMIEKVLHAVTAAATAADPGPVVVVGSSGSGKSSLLHAGMLARMGKDDLPGLPRSTGWPFISLPPGEHPLWRLAAQLADPASEAVELLREDPSRAGELLGARLADRPGERLIVVVDQLEELFTLCADPAERTAFLKATTAIAGRVGDGPPRGLVVFALRADFYDRALAHPDLVPALRDRQVQVVPMTRDELCAAIEEPARVRGWELDKGLAKLIVDELIPTTGEQPETGALPLLSHVLWATWKRREHVQLTLVGYQESGGISQAIATTATEAYRGMSPAEQEAAQRMLLRLVRVGEDSADTARPVERSALLYGLPDVAAARSVLCKLTTDARLLTVDHDTVRLSHEALLRKWPDLRTWIKSDRMNRIRRQKLEDAAKSWKDEGRHPETLYRGPLLADAREWAPHAELSSLAQEFFTRSVEHEEARKRDSRRRTRRLRRLLVLLAVLVVFAVATSVVAVISLRFAQFRADSAIASQASGVANDLRKYDTAAAAQLALTAHRLMPGIDTRSAIRKSGPTSAQPISRSGPTASNAAFPYSPVISGSATFKANVTRLAKISNPAGPAAEQPRKYQQVRGAWYRERARSPRDRQPVRPVGRPTAAPQDEAPSSARSRS